MSRSEASAHVMKEHFLDDGRYHPLCATHPGTCPGCTFASPRWGVEWPVWPVKLRALADKARARGLFALARAIDVASFGDWDPLAAREEGNWKPRTHGFRMWRAAMDLRPNV